MIVVNENIISHEPIVRETNFTYFCVPVLVLQITVIVNNLILNTFFYVEHI